MNDKDYDKPEKNEDSHSENNLPHKNIAQVPASVGKYEQSIKLIVSSYFPTVPAPLKVPAIDNDFQNLQIIERVTESIRYNILCLE